jgi:hypothetical protein
MLKRFLIAVIVLTLAIFYWKNSEKYTDDLVQNDYNFFDSTGIYGTVEHIGYLNHQTGLKIDNISREFAFIPYASLKLNGSNDFSLTATKGDSIIKRSFSDTLILIHENHIYRYKFRQYDRMRK